MSNRNEAVRKKAIRRCRERGIVIPTFAQQRDPSKVPQKVKDRLKNVGLWDFDPANLFRITWKNEPKDRGGLFGGVNHIEIPREITGISARVVGLVGKWFPTGAHKVGAAFGCLVPRLVSGAFDPVEQKAVWPSTGNYCRGGAFDCALLGCTAVAILPEEMSRERFDWLKSIGAEVIATPGCESNVKEIYDECWRIRRERPDCVIFNQFEEFGNYLWHNAVTAAAVDEVYRSLAGPKSRLAAFVSATGSAGTIGTGDALKERHPWMEIAAAEALQCPTLLLNGFGGHRIEGIGDKHVPWIHNVRNTDLVVGVDDEACMRILRLFNEPAGKDLLASRGVAARVIESLPLLGISSICNLLAAIKVAKFHEYGENDVVATIFTDSAGMYGSRLQEMEADRGAYHRERALVDFVTHLHGAGHDYVKELGYWDRKALHNLKYYTWVEQQGRSIEDLNRLWDPSFWRDLQALLPEWEREIEAFNAEVATA